MKTEDRIEAIRIALRYVENLTIPIGNAETVVQGIIHPLKGVLQSLTEERKVEIKAEMKKIKAKQKRNEKNKNNNSICDLDKLTSGSSSTNGHTIQGSAKR